jgi:hypothetical protein
LKVLPQISHTSGLAGIFSSGSSGTGGARGSADLHGRKGVVFIEFSLQRISLFATLIKTCGCRNTVTRKKKK